MKTLVIFFLASIFSVLFLSGCATPQHELMGKVTTGMDKGEVLDVLGGPNVSKRRNGRDIWIYVFYENNKKRGRKFVFHKNTLTDISDYDFNPSLEDRINDSDSFKEYERKIKKDRESAKDEYKDLNGK